MSHAILIAGNASRFVDSIYFFREYLISEKLVTPGKASVLKTAYIDEGVFDYYVSRGIIAKTREPLLLLFSGHGSKFGWGLDDVRTFSYRRLAELLLSGKRPVTIVSDCCHAMAAARTFEDCHVPSERVSLIAATDIDEETPGGLVNTVVNSWGQSRPVRFSSELRWGSRFDSHFYGVGGTNGS